MVEMLERKEEKVSVLSLSGRVDAYSSSEVEQKLKSIIDNEQLWLVLNCEKLEYMSSSGLRVLLAAHKRLNQQQGDMRLACLRPYVKEVFDIAGFTQLFSIFDTERGALDSFAER